MQEILKTQHPAVEAEAYEPPHMTVVPLRTSGMLCGSYGYMEYNETLFEYHQLGEEPSNTATEWDEPLDSDGWGESFF